MTALIIGAYCLLWLLASRQIFGRMRASEIRRFGADKFEGEDVALFGFLSLLGGMLWPLALPLAIVVAKPAKSPEELKAELEARDRRIRELEKQLGMRGEP